MTSTARLHLPLLAAGQAQKEVTHNEALLLLDLLVSPAGAAPSNEAPSTPSIGSVHICGPSPLGAWAGRSHNLAIWTTGGWRFSPAFDGQKVVDVQSGKEWHFRNGGWTGGVVLASELRVEGQKVCGARQPAIANVSGGATMDSQARGTINAILDALRSHGLIAS